MKTLAIGLFSILALCQVGAAELKWMTDLPKAQEKAKAENKLVLLNFTGSDWCIWCKRLSAEVFTKPEFSEYAAKNLVLVEVDFPRSKQQSAELKQANQKLQKKYEIEGYPTLVVLNPQGKEVGKLGYRPGGPKVLIAEVEKLKKS